MLLPLIGAVLLWRLVLSSIEVSFRVRTGFRDYVVEIRTACIERAKPVQEKSYETRDARKAELDDQRIGRRPREAREKMTRAKELLRKQIKCDGRQLEKISLDLSENKESEWSLDIAEERPRQKEEKEEPIVGEADKSGGRKKVKSYGTIEHKGGDSERSLESSQRSG